MEKNYSNNITEAKRAQTKHSGRILLKLEIQSQLYLPESYNILNDEQL